MKFEFILQNTKANQIKILATILLAVNSILIFFLAINLPNNKLSLLPASIGFITAIMNVFLKKKYQLLHQTAVIIIGITWFLLGFVWLGILIVALDFFATKTSKNYTIQFSNENIVLNKVYTSTFNWQQFQNVVLRDGLLTLDFTNNKLLQVNIANEINDAKQSNFNDFCKQQLLSNTK